MGPLTRRAASARDATFARLDAPLLAALRAMGDGSGGGSSDEDDNEGDEDDEDDSGGLPRAFVPLARGMPPLSRQLLLLAADPAGVSPAALLDELRLSPAKRAAAERGGCRGGGGGDDGDGGDGGDGDAVLVQRGVLPPAACARLRRAVDAQRRSAADSVDGGPEEQLNLGAAELRTLVADEGALARLWRLPALLRPRGSGGGNRTTWGALAAAPAEDARIFVRRYSARGRPWNPFHVDGSAVTLNVALSDDGVGEAAGVAAAAAAAGAGGRLLGGRLLACVRGAVRALGPRREGEATVHSSQLLHGVSRMLRGSAPRYALIVFVGSSEAVAAAAISTVGGTAAGAAEEDERREGAALAALMADTAVLARCAAAFGGGGGGGGAKAAAALRASFVVLQRAAPGRLELGRAAWRVVRTYAAPHLLPCRIREALELADAPCWSLRQLVRAAAAASVSAARTT